MPGVRCGSLTLCLTALASGAWAQQPTPWQVFMQPPASPLAREVVAFNDLLLTIMVLIAAFVLGLMALTLWRFRESRNHTPSRTTHNTLVEVLWTTVPVLLLVVIAVPSFRVLFLSDAVADADMTIKAIGRQWYWTYEYPDHGDFAFDAFMVQDEDLTGDQPRLLATDNNIVVPVDTKIRVLVTSSDVLHAWAMPAFALKVDAVPGRTNEIWFEAQKTGMFYGQCSELCGAGHGFMPIAVEVVTKEAFDAWVEQALAEFAEADEDILAPRPVQFIDNQFAHLGAGG